VYQGCFEESRQAQADSRPLRHKADRLMTGKAKSYLQAPHTQ